MLLRSYVDPVLLAIFLHVRHDEINEDLESAVRSFVPTQGASFSSITSKLDQRTQRTMFHEYYHYWQGVRLPFLHRYALASLRQASEAFRLLCQSGVAYTEWSCTLPEHDGLKRAQRLAIYERSRISLSPVGTAPPRDAIASQEVCIVDLMEMGASLAEFQMFAMPGNRTSIDAFKRWQKRYPSYSDLFTLCERFLGNPELALRCMLPLTNAAFYTSDPLRTFVELLARVRGRFVVNASDFSRTFLAQPEPCRWKELFRMYLSELPFEPPSGDERLRPVGGRYHLIGDNWIGAALVGDSGATLRHPLVGGMGQKWLNAERREPRLGWMLDMPGWANCLDLVSEHDLYPSLTIVHVHLPGGDSRVYLQGALCDDQPHAGLQTPSDFRGFLADFMTLYGAVRRAGGMHFNGEQRTCAHVACPHYEDNFCNMYPVIPTRYQECGFPNRFERLRSEWKGR